MKTFGKMKYVLLGVLMTLVCVCSAFLMTGCKANKEEIEIESLPVLEDTRGTENENATITDALDREVTYNKNARKIVTLAWESDLIGLGVKPLAVSNTNEALAEMYASFYKDVEFIDTYNNNFYEAVMAYQPDLIISTTNATWVGNLEKIASTIAVDYAEQDYAVRLNRLAEIFGLQDNAKKLIDYATETKNNAVKKAEQMGLKDKTVTVFGSMQNLMIAHVDFWGAKYDTILFEEFGMKKTQAVEEYLAEANANNTLFSGVSSEAVPNYEADYTLYCDMTGLKEIPPTVQSNPGWMSLKAVQENRVGIIDFGLYAIKDLICLGEQYNQLFSALEVAMGTKA